MRRLDGITDLMDVSLGELPKLVIPGSSVHGIFQARVLEWVAVAISGTSMKQREINVFSVARASGRNHQLVEAGTPISCDEEVLALPSLNRKSLD